MWGGTLEKKTVTVNGIQCLFWKIGNLCGVTSNQGGFSSAIGKSTSLCPISSFPQGFEFDSNSTLLGQSVGVMFSWSDVTNPKMMPLTINASLGIYSNNIDAISGQTLRGFSLMYYKA
jgi:hypothetical protein